MCVVLVCVCAMCIYVHDTHNIYTLPASYVYTHTHTRTHTHTHTHNVTHAITNKHTQSFTPIFKSFSIGKFS